MEPRLIHGDCLQVLGSLEDNSVDAIVTDPPAGIAFMGKSWDKDKGGRADWIAWMAQVASECMRVIKPGGHALVWAIPRTSHWTGMAWEDAGWDPRDKIFHAFGSGFPKGHNLKGDWQGWGTTLKPAVEEWWLFRKPFKGTVASNVLEWGTGGIHVDGCRVEAQLDDENARKDKHGKQKGELYNKRVYSQKQCKYQPCDFSKGRYPTTLIHDGSPDLLALFPITTSGTKLITHKQNVPKFGYGKVYGDFSGGHIKNIAGDTGSATRFFKACPDDDLEDHQARRLFYCAKASKKDRGENNNHPTVKPTSLMRYLCRLITPPGGTILDPFMGSGSTGKAAVLEGFAFVGIEQDAGYIEIARARINAAQDTPTQGSPQQLSVFDDPRATASQSGQKS